MKIIRPLTITDAIMSSSNVAEAAPAAYAGGTTYAIGNVVSVATGQTQAVYTSLQNSNTGHAPASSPTWWEYTSTTYSTWLVGTTYALNDKVIVVGTNSHLIYQSLQASNTGHTPGGTTPDTWWQVIGNTNRWLAFDGSVTSQTLNAENINWTLATTGRNDSVALCNISAYSVTITMTDATDGVVFNQTSILVMPSAIIDFYSYCFEPIRRQSDFVVTGMPPYGGATLSITLTDVGAMVACGACVVGQSFDCGGTQYGMSLGIQDYSIKQKDTFGNYTILQRAFNKRAVLSMLVDSGNVDILEALLAQYRATPIVYIADGQGAYASSIIYGYYKDFSVSVDYPTVSVCSIEIEGLT